MGIEWRIWLYPANLLVCRLNFQKPKSTPLLANAIKI
jgi:hypothetical protein